MSLSVVVPIYRNRHTVSELHCRLRDTGFQKDWRLQIVFVDDRCPEGTRDELAEIAGADANSTVVALRKRVGQQRAVAIGSGYARGRSIAFMDGDLQDRPEDLPLLLSKVDAGAALAIAVRSRAYQGRRRMATSRAFKSWLASATELPPGYGMFLAARRCTLVRALRRSSVGAYLPVALARSADSITPVPIERMPRPEGTSAYGPLSRAALGFRAARTVLHGDAGGTTSHDPNTLVEWSMNSRMTP